MDPLASIQDVRIFGVDITNTDLIDFLLESVSDGVRAAAGCPITATEVTVVREGSWDQNLLLPGSPIRQVSEVLMNGKPVTDWVLRQNRLWRSQGWSDSRSTIEVTYTYGLDEPPRDIVKLVATLVAAGVNEAANGLGTDRNLAYMSIDDYREGYKQGDNEIVDLTELPARSKAWLRERFSGAASVSRSL